MPDEIWIKPAELADVSQIVALRNDPSTLLHLHDANQYNAAQTEMWLRGLPATSKRYSVFEWLNSPSVPVQCGEFVGLVRIDRIDSINRNCAVGLDLVPQHRGKGLSAKVYAWLLDYLFHQLNMHMVYLEVLESNERAIHVYERLGFRVDGRLRQRIFRNGTYEDSILMSLLRSEYES
ncbi:MAG TPA: GNAT family protein [Pirellulales bacterium]|jgi:RimJ/RimL family protein N-acetyltransferase|nr:GNAT family protein [Pirellulales bacterium]